MTAGLLILFYKNPELGKVKTRLGATLGDEAALAIYSVLAEHTRQITRHLDVDKVVYYAQHIESSDQWPASVYAKRLQKGNNLGERLHHAMSNAFADGYRSVVVIGTDCLELDEATLRQAFLELKNNQAVIGPAKDGGYYLLGLNQYIPTLFQNKNWSTETVFADTVKDFETLNISFSRLPILRDVDREEDMPAAWLAQFKK